MKDFLKIWFYGFVIIFLMGSVLTAIMVTGGLIQDYIHPESYSIDVVATFWELILFPLVFGFLAAVGSLME